MAERVVTAAELQAGMTVETPDGMRFTVEYVEQGPAENVGVLWTDGLSEIYWAGTTFDVVSEGESND